MVNIENDWDELLRGEFEQDYYKKLHNFLAAEYKTKTIYPEMHDIFSALKFTPYSEVRAVILGQDPYHGAGQAHGLSFSVKCGVAAPPSLVNIFKELEADLIIAPPTNGCLEAWAKNGVLLLNSVLTVRANSANSHKGAGWEILTDKIISLLNERERPIVFLLWGANAGAKQSLITNKNHLVLTCPHPSPLSAYRGFLGCKHFSKTNEFLKSHGEREINWKLD